MANQIGKWAFIVGIVLAIIMGIGAGLGQGWASNEWLLLLLLIAGLAVGIVNITAKEVQGFLIGAIAVLVTAVAANLMQINTLMIPKLGNILENIISMVVLVIAPAALIVALRAVYGFAAEE